MTPLRVLSLFAGIGGIDLGLERAGMRVAAHSEVDPYACRVLAKHWPDVPNLGDITRIEWSDCPEVDVIAGGFPCQDISFAGKGAGIKEGARSGLWSFYADAVRELRPRYVIVENVAALLARGIGDVLGDLAACGYDAEWDCIPAAAFGVDHRRDRVFIIAYPCGERQQGSWQSPQPVDPASSPYREADRLVDAVRRDALPFVCRGHDGVSDAVDRLRCLGNAVVPQVAQYIGELVVAHHASTSEVAA